MILSFKPFKQFTQFDLTMLNCFPESMHPLNKQHWIHRIIIQLKGVMIGWTCLPFVEAIDGNEVEWKVF